MSSSTCNLCPVCRGSGNLVTFSRGLEYWPCSPCGGSGVRAQHGPAAIVSHGRPAKGRKGRMGRMGRAPQAEIVPFPLPSTLRAGNNAAQRAAEALGVVVNPRIATADLA